MGSIIKFSDFSQNLNNKNLSGNLSESEQIDFLEDVLNNLSFFRFGFVR